MTMNSVVADTCTGSDPEPAELSDAYSMPSDHLSLTAELEFAF